MSGRLDGRRAFVTGAANGIGKAIAEAFAREGARVCCADLDGAGAARLASALEAAHGAKALGIACDVTASASVREAIEAASGALEGLDLLVSNAATFTPLVPLHELDERDWHQALDVNLTGAFHTCKHGIPHLRTAGGGAVILTASQMGRVANAGQAAYCATKGALLQLAKAMAIELAADGIRVNALSPGGVATDRMLKRFGSMAEAERVWGPKHPLGRLGQPPEIAAAAVFLACDESSFMTGADLLVDGGYTAW